MGGNDPLNSTRFFNPKFPNISKTIDKENISYLLPNKFQEKFLRLFIKDPSKEENAKKGFIKFVKSCFLSLLLLLLLFFSFTFLLLFFTFLLLTELLAS